MATAKLKYVIDRDNGETDEVYLENTSLRLIDYFTKSFKSSLAMEKSEKYHQAVSKLKERNNNRDGRFELIYIENNDRMELLPILYNDNRAISIGLDINQLSDKNNEIEKARKLLWSSKNKLFVKLFLADERLKDTTETLIRL